MTKEAISSSLVPLAVLILVSREWRATSSLLLRDTRTPSPQLRLKTVHWTVFLYAPLFASPPKPAGLPVVHCVHFSSPGCARLGFESHVLFSLFLLSRYTKYEIRVFGGRSCNQFEPLVKYPPISRYFPFTNPIYIKNCLKKQLNYVFWE